MLDNVVFGKFPNDHSSHPHLSDREGGRGAEPFFKTFIQERLRSNWDFGWELALQVGVIFFRWDLKTPCIKISEQKSQAKKNDSDCNFYNFSLLVLFPNKFVVFPNKFVVVCIRWDLKTPCIKNSEYKSQAKKKMIPIVISTIFPFWSPTLTNLWQSVFVTLFSMLYTPTTHK